MIVMNPMAGELASEVTAGSFFEQHAHTLRSSGLTRLLASQHWATMAETCPEVEQRLRDTKHDHLVCVLLNFGKHVRETSEMPMLMVKAGDTQYALLKTPALVLHLYGDSNDGECDGIHTRGTCEKLAEYVRRAPCLLLVPVRVCIWMFICNTPLVKPPTTTKFDRDVPALRRTHARARAPPPPFVHVPTAGRPTD
jgi:hypothetical protein